MKDRRNFLKTGAALITALPVFAEHVNASEKDIERSLDYYDPGRKLVRDGQSHARKNKKNNIPPVLREEILDNPRAVFVIRTSVVSQKDSEGKFPPEKEQFEVAGYNTALRIFCKGAKRAERPTSSRILSAGSLPIHGASTTAFRPIRGLSRVSATR